MGIERNVKRVGLFQAVELGSFPFGDGIVINSFSNLCSPFCSVVYLSLGSAAASAVWIWHVFGFGFCRFGSRGFGFGSAEYLDSASVAAPRVSACVDLALRLSTWIRQLRLWLIRLS